MYIGIGRFMYRYRKVYVYRYKRVYVKIGI